MTEVIAIIVLGALVATLLATAWNLLRHPSRRESYVQTVTSVRVWMIPLAITGVLLVCATAVVLTRTWPVLGWGWWKLIGGSGNVALGQTAFGGPLWRCIALTTPVLLALLVPWLAYQEEVAFRYGSEHDSWPRILRTQTVFGLAHPLFMGVPIAAGVALVIAGLLFQVTYLATLHRLMSQLPHAIPTPLPVRALYPSVPDGPYNPAEWQEHIQECHVIGVRNHRLIDEWADVELKRIEANETRLRDSRSAATAVSAAVHAIYNWLLLGLLIASLVAAAY